MGSLVVAGAVRREPTKQLRKGLAWYIMKREVELKKLEESKALADKSASLKYGFVLTWRCSQIYQLRESTADRIFSSVLDEDHIFQSWCGFCPTAAEQAAAAAARCCQSPHCWAVGQSLRNVCEQWPSTATVLPSSMLVFPTYSMTASLVCFLSAPEATSHCTQSQHFIEYDSRDFLPMQCQCIYSVEASMTGWGSMPVRSW